MPTMVERLAAKVYEKRNPDKTMPPYRISLGAAARYPVDKAAAVVARRRTGPDVPWITPEAQRHLATLLRPTDAGLEYGAGGSTVWLGRHTRSVVAVEAFDHWYESLVQRVQAAGLDNVTTELVSANALGYRSPEHREAYVNVRPDLQPGSLDYVFVDGEYRDDSTLRALDLLRPGGLLVLDNANSYLPGPGRTPMRVTAPASAAWSTVASQLKDWRMVWTSNGLWDTALWIKP